MPTHIGITGIEARTKAIKGMSYVASAVRSTIGPYGLNFILEKENKSTNDGYLISVALAPTIIDEFERRGALTALEASSKTNVLVGDATSTAWALTEAIVKEAVRFLPNEKTIKAKKTPAEINMMISTSKDAVIAQLEHMAVPITDKETLIKSALVSVENEAIAHLLGTMQWELGHGGQIIAEEVNEIESSIEKVSGIRIDNGFGGSYLVTNLERQSLEIDNQPILLTNHVIGEAELLMLRDTIFNGLIAQKKSSIVIIARAFDAAAIKKCQESSQSGFAIFPINAPYVNQREIMKDIEAVVGGRHIDTEAGSLSDIYITDIGFCKRLEARIGDAVVTGIENEESIKRKAQRVAQLEKALSGEKSDFYRKMIEARIAQLSNGFAILKVGSISLVDRKRLKDKCDDAVNAVRLALKGGTVPGAGKAFLDISETLPEDDILKRPLRVVYDQIISSAPEDYQIPEWVRDPYHVLKCALENACESASVFANNNGMVVTKNRKEKKDEDDE